MRTRYLTFSILSISLLILVAFIGLPISAGYAASAAPTITNFTVTPATLSSGGGDVFFSVNVTGASSCTLSSSPAVAGLPKTVACTNQLFKWPAVVVPENSSAQSVTFTFSLTAAPPSGGTVTASAGPITVSVSPPGANIYVALGDSYASGEGNPRASIDPWVDHDGNPAPTDGCDRSVAAYPMLVKKWLGNDKNLPPMNLQFLACSGATTGDLWRSGATGVGLKAPSRRAPRQLLDTGDLANARVITVSIGGNDLNFADVLAHCVVIRVPRISCSATSTDPWIAQLKAHIDALGPVLVSTYATIEKEAAPGTPLYVVGYPDLFPAKPTTVCVARSLMSVAGMTYLSSMQKRLAGVIKAAARQAHAIFVDPNLPASSSTYIGHSICAHNSYFRGADFSIPQYSFHPNALGQQALAADVEAAISS